MFDPAFTFERFVVGSTNQLAVSAARRAAESPGRAYNPLVICGTRGSGKTHLLSAIARYASLLEPDLSIHLEGVEALADRISRGIAVGDMAAVQGALAGVDILLIDEVDRVSGMERTQEELAEVVTTMAIEGRQVVLATRLPPAQIEGLILAFRNTLELGLVVEIGALDEEMRQTFIDRVAGERGAALSRDVIRALAACDFEEGRTLRRAVDRLIELAQAEQRQPTPGDVLRILGDDPSPEPADEFGSFLDDVSKTLAAVVETAPWRRRIAQAILRWEGEGLRTTRLDEALMADTAPNVDALLDSFEHDAARLLQIRRELGRLAVDERLEDPAELERAERVLQSAESARRSLAAAAVGANGSAPIHDSWFLNTEKVVLDWSDPDSRLMEDPR